MFGQGRPGTGNFLWDPGLTEQVVVEAVSSFVGPTTIDTILARTAKHEQRVRRLPAPMVVWLVIGIGLFNHLDMVAIWRQIVGTLRVLYLALTLYKPPSKSTLSQARQRLTARPLRQLFLETSKPMATDRTRGAFYKGMRLMAIDGTRLDVPDTKANAKAFGRPTTKRNDEVVAGAYPQILAVCLDEIGTHMIYEAVVKSYRGNEYAAGSYLLEKTPSGSLVLWDKGFYGYSHIQQAKEQGKELLARVPSHVVFERVRDLPDGSYLANIYPTTTDKKRGTNGLLVRVIDYTFDDPGRPGHAERHRLVTTLLDAETFPAEELIVLYHERWEIEIGYDELKTHQLGQWIHLRSRTPVGVIQELYGLFIAYNAVRHSMHEAALAIDLDPRRLSFIHAVRVIRDTVPLMRRARTMELPTLYAAMIALIGQGVLPPRDNRINPRVIKRKMSNFAKKRPEHRSCPQPQKRFHEGIVMLT